MTHSQTNIAQIFKAEFSNLVAALCHFYKINNLQLAEDIVSDTFLKAMKVWSHNGLPENPKAWLRKVAVNQLKDHFKKTQTFTNKVKSNLLAQTDFDNTIEINDEIIEDSQLNMIFVVCNNTLKIEAQICLALRILCGLNIDEIAAALLSNKENINKKLYRAKQKLKENQAAWKKLSKTDYAERLESVLRIIYLLFNEGYYSSTSNLNVRKEICWEAMRLAIFLSKKDFLNQKNIYALIALMCFHASRFESRIDNTGDYVLLSKQDRSKWNQDLIAKGESYLARAAQGNKASKYHLESAIAYWHTTDSKNKWENILQLYNKLLTIEYSPIIAMNRTYALAMANSVDQAIGEALKLKLEGNHLYFSLIAALYKMKNNFKAELKYLKLAIASTKNEKEIALIKRKIETAIANQKD